jgi:hypothetical protein
MEGQGERKLKEGKRKERDSENDILKAIEEYRTSHPARRKFMAQDRQNVAEILATVGIDVSPSAIGEVWARQGDKKRHRKAMNRRKDREADQENKIKELKEDAIKIAQEKKEIQEVARKLVEEKEELERKVRDIERMTKEVAENNDAEEDLEGRLNEATLRWVAAEIERDEAIEGKEKLEKDLEEKEEKMNERIQEIWRESEKWAEQEVDKRIDAEEQLKLMEEEIEHSRVMIKAWETTIAGRERVERELREEKEKMMREIGRLRTDSDRIRGAMTEAGKWIIVPELFSMVAAIRAGERTKGEARMLAKIMDGMCEDPTIGRVDFGDWRKRLSKEEVEKHFKSRRGEVGVMSRYHEDYYGLADLIRNLWAHHSEHGFRSEIDLFDWSYDKWPAFWGVIAEMCKTSERMNLPHVVEWRARLEREYKKMKMVMKERLEKMRKEVEEEERKRRGRNDK